MAQQGQAALCGRAVVVLYRWRVAAAQSQRCEEVASLHRLLQEIQFVQAQHHGLHRGLEDAQYHNAALEEELCRGQVLLVLADLLLRRIAAFLTCMFVLD